MLLAKNSLLSDRTVNINLEFMIKGGVLPFFIVKNNAKPAISRAYQ